MTAGAALHAMVWIDHQEAKIFHLDAATFVETTVKAPQHHVTRKPQDHGRHEGDDQFFHAVADKLAGAERILVVGPSSGKLDFLRFVHKHAHAIESAIVGVETLDHPTDRQLAAYVRHYFQDKLQQSGPTSPPDPALLHTTR